MQQPTPAVRPAAISDGLSPTRVERARSSPSSRAARRIIPGAGLRQSHSRRYSPTASVGWCAMVDRIQGRPTLLELGAHPVHVVEELLLAVIAPANAGLIGDHNQQMPGLPCRTTQLEDAVDELGALGRADIAVIDIDHSVAIEEQGPAVIHRACPAVAGTSCCARR